MISPVFFVLRMVDARLRRGPPSADRSGRRDGADSVPALGFAIRVVHDATGLADR